MSSKRLLHEIFKRNAPSAHWIRGIVASHFGDGRLLAELPDPSGSIASYADAVAEELTRQALVNEAFLAHLALNLPNEQRDINDIRRMLSIPMHIEEAVSFDGLMDNWVYQDVADRYGIALLFMPFAYCGGYHRFTQLRNSYMDCHGFYP